MGSHTNGYSWLAVGTLLPGFTFCGKLPGQPAPSWERVFSTELCYITAPRDLLWGGLAGGTHGTGTGWSGGGLSTAQSSSGGPAHLHLLVFLILTLMWVGRAAALMHRAGMRASGWIFIHYVSKQLQGCSNCPQPPPALSQHQTSLTRHTSWATNDGQRGCSAADRHCPWQASEDRAHSSGVAQGCSRGRDCRQ